MSVLLIANWKMNLDFNSVKAYCTTISSIPRSHKIKTIIAPSFMHMHYIQEQLASRHDIVLAAQDCSAFADGPHTGDISAKMLKENSCKYVIIGHSERRDCYGEREDLLAEKIERAYEEGITPIYCIGENFEARHTNTVLTKLRQQLRDIGLANLSKTKAVIAYEPIWSIGTGLTPTAEQITEVADFINEILPGQTIVYGGSVSLDNAASIASLPHINGLLIGKASTDITQFSQIAQAIIG